VACSLEVTIKDVASFVSDPLHPGVVRGTIAVEGLTSGTVAVEHGIFNLLTAEHGSPRRVTSFALPFGSADGTLHTLIATKTFHRHDRRDLWEESTTLVFRIHRGPDPKHPVIGRGTMKNTLLHALGAATSLHDVGHGGLLERAQARFQFLKFYFSTLATVA